MGYASPNAATVSRLDAILEESYTAITESLFEDGISSGDMTNPERINDGLLVDYVNATVDEYTIVDFGMTLRIRQYRFHGHADCDGGSILKIQYWNGVAWVDWVTGITGLNGASWKAWGFGDLVSTTKIKVICTVNPTVTRFTEMSMKV